jgi:pyrroloquinoline quinone biosynthesis protein B
MKLLVLCSGLAAGIGLADWTPPVLALADEAGQWLLLNAEPAAIGSLRHEPRLAALAGDHAAPGAPRTVVLLDASVDQASGLLGLRHGAPLRLYATPAVFEGLAPALPTMQRSCGLQWKVLPVAGDRRVAEFRVDGMPTLQFTAIAASPALAKDHHGAISADTAVGDSIALAVHDLTTGGRLVCATAGVQLSGVGSDLLRNADCVIVNAALDDPAVLRGLGRLPARYKLVCGSGSHGRPTWQGLQVARAGMEIRL